MIDLRAEHLAIVKSTLSEHMPDAKAFVFGSRVNGTAKEHSDLDLAIKGRTNIDTKALRKLKQAFEDSDLPFRVDVIDWTATKEGFRKIIEDQMVPLDH